MHGNSREKCARLCHRRWGVASLLSLLIGMSALLSACSSGGNATNDDRQFATDRHTEVPGTETETPVPTPAEIPTLVSTPVATPLGSSVRPVSPVGTIYAVAEGGVIAVDVITGNTRVITRNDRSGDIVRIASSPNGDRVAVLRAHKADKKTQYDLEIWSSDGKAIKTWKEAESRLDRVAEPGKGKALVDWSGDGTRVAVAFPDGGIVAFPVDGGDATVLLTRGQAPGPMSMDWSPDGSVIAFASKSAGGKGASLSLATVETLPVDPVRIAGTGGDRPIRGVWWLPDSSGVLAIQGRPNAAVEIGGDVVSVDRRTLTPHTVIGASRFGPTSAIVAAAPAPDGQTVAYAVVTADGFGGWVASVWIRQPDSSLVQVKLPPKPQVATIGWTASGLATTLIEPDRVRVIVSSDNGQPVPTQPVIEATPLASPISEGSPVASPMASPVAPPIAATPEAEASPVGSPLASPIATPGATPDLSR